VRPLLLVLSLLSSPALAATVLRAGVPELAAASDLVVHGVVRVVDDAVSQGPFRTVVEVELLEVLKGRHTEPVLRLVLPGGRRGDLTMVVPGMPRFAPGDEVVLLLERTARGYAFAGLAQGVFKVDRGGRVPIVTRDLRELDFVVPRKQPLPADLGPASRLDDLLQRLREVAR
jgi:hypothetical protein